jgi:hypothetical protein
MKPTMLMKTDLSKQKHCSNNGIMTGDKMMA